PFRDPYCGRRVTSIDGRRWPRNYRFVGILFFVYAPTVVLQTVTERMDGEDEVRVLFVDDEHHIVELAATALERAGEGFVVHTETSGAAALSHLDDARVDCVVSDYRMPGMDGLALLERVREEHPDLPFVLSTGKGSED